MRAPSMVRATVGAEVKAIDEGERRSEVLTSPTPLAETDCSANKSRRLRRVGFDRVD